MDWSKAKNYIILGLLLTNLILLGSILRSQGEFAQQNQLSPEAVKKFYQLLEQRHITLKEKIPSYPQELPGLQIRYDTMKDTMYPLLFKEYGSYMSTSANRVLRLNMPTKITTLDEALIYVQNFTQRYFPDEQFAIKNSVVIDGTTSIHLTSLYNGYPMEDSTLLFKFIEKNATLEMEKTNVEPIQEEGLRAVTGPINALMKQLQRIPPGSSIDAITLVYYNAYNPTAAQTRLAPAVPTWRIRLGNGSYLYEPAFSY